MASKAPPPSEAEQLLELFDVLPDVFLFAAAGAVSGLAGILRPFDHAGNAPQEYRRLFGISPTDYILRTRLLVARQMLERSATTVGEVAVACGFYDQSHFTKAFKAHTGLPPQAYRRRARVRGRKRSP